jgi:hypothetical protein
MELEKNCFRNVNRFKPKDYNLNRVVLERPVIKTLNTLKGKIKYSPSGYWLKIPNKLLNKMGVRVNYSQYDLKVILVKKVV